MISEFYHLRRTAAKDIAGYLGFLTGFIGSAPFAWGLLARQLESGTFVRGLWYFFGIVVAGGIFAGVAGLGIGYAGGLLWEQIHRHRRRERAVKSTRLKPESDLPELVPHVRGHDPLTPSRLQLVDTAAVWLPDITGRKVEAVRFASGSAELDIGSAGLSLGANVLVTIGGQRWRFPEAGSRDAICSVIGARVEKVRLIPADRVEISFDNGSQLAVSRSALAVA